MNFLSISGFFQTLDPREILPEVNTFLSICMILIIVCMLIGPVLLFLAGLKYLRAPSALPNHKAGFRTYFGMGSKAAWDYTQQLAGRIWTILGGLMTVVMVILCFIFFAMDAAQVAYAALICLIIQASLAILSWILITALVTINFDKEGLRRR